MSGDDESRSSQRNGSVLGVVLGLGTLVANALVVYEGQLEVFRLVMPSGGDYYQFHEAMLWLSVTLVVLFGLLAWLGCVTVCSGNERFGYLTGCVGGLVVLALVVSLVTQYVMMGGFWHRDPEHTMFWYRSYWTEGVTNFTQLENATVTGIDLATVPHWPYVTSDIVVRVYGWVLMALTVCLGLVAGCGGSAYACSQCCA